MKARRLALLVACLLTLLLIGAVPAFAAPPDHDDFNSARAVPALPYEDSVDTSEATADDDDPLCPAWLADEEDEDVSNDATVWYRFTPTSDMRVEADTFDSEYDTTLSVYTGARGALDEVVCNDDARGTFQSRVRFTAFAGTTYHIMVGAFPGSDGGALEFTMQQLEFEGRPAMVRGSTWFLRETLSGGPADWVFNYGRATDHKLFCDFWGDGEKTPVVVRGATWLVKDDFFGGPADWQFRFGRPGDVPVCGNWDPDEPGDGIGMVRGNTWFLQDWPEGGRAHRTVTYGRAGDTPVVGDWNGNGADSIGVVRGDLWLLKDRIRGGAADRQFRYGRATDVPVVGDWNASGSDGPGVVRGNAWFLRNTTTGGAANRVFRFGRAGDLPLIWDE